MREAWRSPDSLGRLPLVGGLANIEQGARKRLHIEGGIPLSGTITAQDIRGGKNMLSPIMLAASLLTGPSIIRNVPNIGELSIVDALHIADITPLLDNSSILVMPRKGKDITIPSEVGALSRTSIVAAGALLAKQRYADIPLPGGDDLGERDITTHIEGLQVLGAHVDTSVPGRLRFSAPEGLKGGRVRLRYPRITATETLILAAMAAEGQTTLENTALDPEVDALISFLNRAGANIQRLPIHEGKASRTIIINETNQLKGVEYTIPMDRSAIVTYAVAAIATKSREGLFVKGARISELYTFLSLIHEMGGGVRLWDDAIEFYYKDSLHAPERTVISMNERYTFYDESENHVGIYADWQPLVAPLFFQAEGTTTVIETAHPDRFHHLRAAQEAGADITFFQPREETLPTPYLFDPAKSNFPHGACIHGGFSLPPLHIKGRDIRLGAFGVIQGLATEGISTVEGVDQIERGYHNLVQNLVKLGANISVE